MIFDLISQEDDIASAQKAAGISEQGGTVRVLQRVLWRYFLAVWCLLGMTFGLKAMAIGIFLIWLGHPVLISMRLSDLTRQNRIVLDSGQHSWFISIGGIPDREKIISLKNVFFYSLEEMQTVLIGFCRVRFLLYAAALLVALYDLYAQCHGVNAGDHLGQLAVAMGLANVVFFTRRSVAYYRLLTLGQRQDWHVGTVSVNSRHMFAAYNRCQSKGDVFYVPYLLAIFTPQLA